MTKRKQPQSNRERELVFDSGFLEDLRYGIETDRKIALRLLALVEEIRRDPFGGTGKLEPLTRMFGPVVSHGSIGSFI